MKSRSIFFSLFIISFSYFFLSCAPSAPDMKYYRRVVTELSSSRYQGRGYAREGVRLTSAYLQREYRHAGVDNVELQPFTFDVNTHSGHASLSIDGHALAPGYEWTLREFSPAVHGTFPLYRLDTLGYTPGRLLDDLRRPEYRGAFVVCDYFMARHFRADLARLKADTTLAWAGMMLLWEHPEQRTLTYEPYVSAASPQPSPKGKGAVSGSNQSPLLQEGVGEAPLPLKYYKAESATVLSKPDVWVRADALPADARRVTIDVDNQFYKDYATENVIARIDGLRHDSCYVLTAHYDHLGTFGPDVFYGGANDNASGTAALLTLARYFARHRPPFDILLVSFSGEDCGLYGSTYYAEHPLVPLDRVKYLINIDMIGDNNPTLYSEASEAGMDGWRRFDELNKQGGYFRALERGALAANSDHYPFAVRGVPCIFLENEGGDAFPYYHTPLDDVAHIRFDSALPVIQLVIDFVEK